MANPNTIQSSTLPPAQPTYILRGHAAQIHSVCFWRGNLRLVTGDADGWVVVWALDVKRAVGVWRAHGGAVMGVGVWGAGRVLTHGRDNKLHVWQLRSSDEAGLSKVLPIDDPTPDNRKAPWLLHSLDVNALNFCAFGMCYAPDLPSAKETSSTSTSLPIDGIEEEEEERPILIAVPGLQDGHINITHLPSETRVATIPPPPNTQTAMLMAVALHPSQPSRPNSNLRSAPPKAGLAGFAVVAGYESGHIAVFHPSPSKNQWTATYVHKTHAQPVLSLALAPKSNSFYSSGADAIIAKHPISPLGAGSEPEVVLNTKHAGQQGLCVRSDERVFASAGWDGRARVYDCSMKVRELACLKWHKEGCYALAFAEVDEESAKGGDHGGGKGNGGEGQVVNREPSLTVAQRRVEKTRTTHWLAAGSKDGKVSLWDVY